MSWQTALAILAFALAALPVGLFLANLAIFRRAPVVDTPQDQPVSVLIPARDEERSIGDCVTAALASCGPNAEVIVLDDHSQDGTAAIVRKMASRDSRLRLESAPPLPSGWCGKQHACHVLSTLAMHDLLLFIDADVRLSADAVARSVAFLQQGGSGLVSGFPKQQTGSFFERLLLPLIHVVLLGYLPLKMMRQQPLDASFGAGCGQWFLARRNAYEQAGGHAAIRRSLHDGIKLPRSFRTAGQSTDIFDATDTATCRMYVGNAATWQGLAKNATEGMASPRAILPWTLLLLGGHVLPAVLLLLFVFSGTAMAYPLAFSLVALATFGLYVMRLSGARRFGHSMLGVVLHPLAVLILVAVQWTALIKQLAGRPAAWKGRAYAPAAAE